MFGQVILSALISPIPSLLLYCIVALSAVAFE